MKAFLLHFFIIILTTLFFSENLDAQTDFGSPNIVAIYPRPNQVNVDGESTITIQFDQPVDTLNFDDILNVYGERAGKIEGSNTFDQGDSAVVFTPFEHFSVGDRITAILARQPDGQGILSQGYVWEFEVAPQTGGFDFFPVQYSTDIVLTAVVAADLDGDAFMDVAYTGNADGADILELSYFRNNQFVPGSRVDLPDRVRPLYTGDLNADGLPDFVLIHRGRAKYSIPPRISICHLLPNGSLSLEETFIVGTAPAGRAEPRGAVINDVNQDGFLDIVVLIRSEVSRRAAFVYLNDGTGHFEIDPRDVFWFDRDTNAQSLFGRDLNGSGFIDIGLGHTSGTSNILLFTNTGEGLYNQVKPDLTLSTGNRDLEISAAVDVTGDLLPDVFTVDFANNALLLFANQRTEIGELNFTSSPQIFQIIENPNWLDYADIDADGDIDLALSGSRRPFLQLAHNENGSFTHSTNAQIPGNPTTFAVGDFTGNQALDFVVADTAGILTLVVNNTSGFEAPVAPSLLLPQDEELISDSFPQFEWNVPSDANADDFLHFRITIITQNGDSFVFESPKNPKFFEPLPPVPQGQGTMRFVYPAWLGDGTYSWFVEAWDGLLWSEPSSEWQFTLDTTAPENVQLAFPGADYGIWFALDPGESISATLSYTEIHADYAVLSTSGIGGPFTFQNIPSGENVSTQLTFDPDASSDGEYQVQAQVFDRAQLFADTSQRIGVDRNPPTGGIAIVESDISPTRDFRVSWNGADDGSGSGISGYYRVQYRKDNGPWNLWIEKTSAGDSLFKGSHGSTYAFEAAAFDHVGFVESFTNTAEAQVTVDVFANDKTAPPPPVNIRANGENPSPWQKSKDFSVRWDLPPDESGIKTSYWKLGQPPVSNDDYDKSEPPKGPADVTVDNDGAIPLYVWLADSAGNVDYQKTAQIELRRDSTPATLSTLNITQPASRYIDADGQPWYNSKKDKIYSVSLTYSEMNPQRGVLTTDGLTDSLFKTGINLPSGENVSTTFSVNVVNPADRLYNLRATIRDSADNWAAKSHKIGLDGTAPQNSLASAPSISATEAFTVSWSAGDDGTGSGIAAYDLYYKAGNADWQPWFRASQPGDSTFNGQNGVEYRFESIARDNVGHAETFSENGETRVLVDLSANDKDAPPPPINLLANGSSPSPWRNNAQFTITWTKPDDESGVVASYWKMGEPPVSNTDTSGIGGSGPAQGPMTVTLNSTGKQMLHIWLVDAKGNVDYRNAASVQLRFDADLPIIADTRFLKPGYGDDWFNPNTTATADFEITYHEQFASHLNIKSTAFNYNINESPLQSGVGVKKSVALDLTARTRNKGELIVTLADSAGNASESIDTLRLDSTPPAGSLASSPGVSGKTSFPVSWTSGVDEGVGVSDTFDVYVKVNQRGWTRWLDDVVGRSATFEDAQDGNNYHFEAVARDWLGNEEIRTYAHESTTFINTALSDSLPPQAPINLRAHGANPSPWRRTPGFTVTWQSPDDPTGTPIAHYKLGAEPTSNADTTGSFIGEPPLNINATKENGQWLFIWLEDGARNVDYRNAASVLLRFDQTKPTIDSLVLSDPKPAFVESGNHWYNPTVPPHRSSLLVYFYDRHVSSVLLEPSDLFESGGVIPDPGIDSARFNLEFAGFDDNVVTLNITVADSAGNSTEKSTLISLDSTAPRNTRAQSPDTTKPGDFIVSWDVSQVIEEGAGLSGVFDVRVKVDEAPWELWQARYKGTSITYNGQDGHTYAFEVVAYDNVGNKESFTGIAESITKVVTQFVDTTAPAAPTDITINGEAEPRWSSESEFEMAWTSPSDPSGIAKIYYKFYTPPSSSDDFAGSAAGNPPIAFEFSDEGHASVYLWLEDGAGNSDYRNYGQSLIKYDGVAPQIKSSLVSNAVYDNKWLNPDSAGNAQIRVTYAENYPDSIRLFFGGTVVNEQPEELLAGVDQEIDFIVSLNDVNDGCYPLAVILTDSAGNAFTDSFFVCLDSQPPTGARASSPEQSISSKFTVSWAGDGLGDDADGSGLSGEYDLRMRIGEGEWFDLFERTKLTSYTYVGVHENTFSFEVAAWDHTGNREVFTGIPETTTVIDTAFVDQTAPDIPIDLSVRGQNPSPWQKGAEFLVEWQNPSDPSGIRTAYFKFDEIPTSASDFDDSVSVETDAGRAFITTMRQYGQICYVWLEDGRGNSDYTRTAAIVLRYDATPPVLFSITAAQTVNGQNWFNQLEKPDISFDVFYQETHADSLFLYSDSLGREQIKITDQNVASDTAQISMHAKDALDGLYWLYAFVSDSAGHRSNIDSIRIMLDSYPPRVEHTVQDTVVTEQIPITIQATATDANALQKVELLYWQGGERQKQAVAMKNMNDSTYQANIPAPFVGNRGIEYIIVADDGVNQTRFPLTAENKAPLAIRVRLNEGLAMPEPLRHGSDENAYQMVTFPLDVEQPTGENLLENKLGAYEATAWRFFRWNPVDMLFNEYPDMGELRHGLAFWLITTKQNIKLETGAGVTVNTVKPFKAVLKKGWNDIGVPFNFPVDWNDIISFSAIDTQKVQGPHGYDGRWVYPFENKILQPWCGYSVYSEEDDISIIIPALESQPQLAKSQPFRKDAVWAFEIKAQSNDMIDAANYFGCAKSATDGWDYGLDFVEAPEIGSYVSLFFEHDDWDLDATRFTTDFRPPKKGDVWQFQLVSNKTDHEVRLVFQPLLTTPKSLELKLVDEEASMSIDLINDSTYTFKFSSDQIIRHFKIYAGDAEYMQHMDDELSNSPQQREPVRNFPNPFNSSTVISYELTSNTQVDLAVYNLLAQKVCQLRLEFQEKGFYQVSWDARDDNGRQLGTGVYILRLETPDFNYTCKMVYMR